MYSSIAVPYDTTPDKGWNDWSGDVCVDGHRAARNGCVANPKHTTITTTNAAPTTNTACTTSTTWATGRAETADANDVAPGAGIPLHDQKLESCRRSDLESRRPVSL